MLGSAAAAGTAAAVLRRTLPRPTHAAARCCCSLPAAALAPLRVRTGAGAGIGACQRATIRAFSAAPGPGEPYVSFQEVTPGMERDFDSVEFPDGPDYDDPTVEMMGPDPTQMPNPEESKMEGPRSSRDRLAAYAEMRHLIELETANDITEMKKEIKFLAASYKLASQRLAEEPDTGAEVVRAECERRGVMINDELKNLEAEAEMCFGEGWNAEDGDE